MMKSRRVKNLTLFVAATILFVLYIFPFVLIIINSLKSRTDIIRNPLSLPAEFSLTNFIEAFQAMNFPRTFLNSLFITVSSLLIIILFSSMLAYFLSRWDWRMNKFIFLILVLSMLVPFQVLMIPFVTIFGNFGLFNSRISLIFFYLGFGVAQATFLFHGFIKSIPREIEEAALVDGASRVKVFFQIIFPMLKPITSTIAILNVLWIWNDFWLPSLVLSSPEVLTIPLSTASFFGRFSAEFGIAMAALILAIIPIVIFYLILQKKIIKGIVDGALK